MGDAKPYTAEDARATAGALNASEAVERTASTLRAYADMVERPAQMADPALAGANGGTMKVWLDTEFIEDGKTIDLISIGLVREDGEVLYVENSECDLSRADAWVRENVITKLTGPRATRAEIAVMVRDFVGPSPEFWAYYADYDWVVLCQLYGRMIDLPKGWPMYCRDLKQEADRRSTRLPQQTDGADHNALADAKWTRDSWHALEAAGLTRVEAAIAAVSAAMGRRDPGHGHWCPECERAEIKLASAIDALASVAREAVGSSHE